MVLQMFAGISELIVWLTLIAAIAVPSMAWGSSITKINQLVARIDQQDKAIAEQNVIIEDMKEKFNETKVQFATITTLLEQNIVPSINDLKVSIREHAKRAEGLIDTLIKTTGNDKKGNS